MGARGPKPTPTETLKARGSWLAKDRADSLGPLFPVDEPNCPTWLSKEAKAEWKRVVKWLVAARLTAQVSRSTLAAYCQCWGRWHKAEMQIKKNGEVLVSKKTGVEYQSSWVSIANNAMEKMTRLAAEFGMTPASAGKVTQAGSDSGAEQDEDPAEKFFRLHVDGKSA